MKIAKKVKQVKIEKTLDFKSQKVLSIIPEINRDNVSSIVRSDDISQPKEVFTQLNNIRQNYLNLIENLNEDEKEYLYTLINNVLIIENKMISMERRRIYEKLYSRTAIKGVDEKLKKLEKYAGKVENLIQQFYLSEQIWSDKIWLLNKKEKKKIAAMSETNHKAINSVSFGVTAKWVAYRNVYNSMEIVEKVIGLKGKRKITYDKLKEIVNKEQKKTKESLSVT
ncbi:MAG: hypothetical protein J6Q13_01985 [Clostridia bacterium]|nr:hypothetical protein [Clostridia bacterium]